MIYDFGSILRNDLIFVRNMANPPTDQNAHSARVPNFWIVLVAIVILLIFLLFYPPFEAYLVTNIPQVHFNNVVFWFASLIGVVGYAVAHWQSFRKNIIRNVSHLDAETLVFDSLQTAILIALIFCAGAILQAIEMLSEHLIYGGPIIDAAFGTNLLGIIVLVILAILFYLLHFVVRAFRIGWQPRRPPHVTNSKEIG